MSLTLKWLITAGALVIVGAIPMFIRRKEAKYDCDPIWAIGCIVCMFGLIMFFLFVFGLWLGWILN